MHTFIRKYIDGGKQTHWKHGNRQHYSTTVIFPGHFNLFFFLFHTFSLPSPSRVQALLCLSPPPASFQDTYGKLTGPLTYISFVSSSLYRLLAFLNIPFLTQLLILSLIQSLHQRFINFLESFQGIL